MDELSFSPWDHMKSNSPESVKRYDQVNKKGLNVSENVHVLKNPVPILESVSDHLQGFTDGLRPLSSTLIHLPS